MDTLDLGPKYQNVEISTAWSLFRRNGVYMVVGIKGRHKSRQSIKETNDWKNMLVRVSSSRDKVAFAALFNHYAPRLKSLMLRMGTEQAMAEEVVQETMLSVWRKCHLYNPSKASVSTWIFTIARNLRIDRFRKENRPELDPHDPALVVQPDPSADEQLAVKDRYTLVKECLATLPEKQREAVQLAFIEDLSHQQISERLGIPLGTVKSRLRLSFEKLRLILGSWT